MPLVSGAIGEELAAAFLGFKSVIKDLPDINGILMELLVKLQRCFCFYIYFVQH